MDATTLAVYGMSAIGIVVSLVGIAKRAGLPSRWAPVFSLLVGILVGIAATYSMGQPVLAGAAAGVLLGASACGVYDLGKNIPVEAAEQEAEPGPQTEQP